MKLEDYYDSIETDPRLCNCGSKLPKRALNDARGIFCSYVCDKCEEDVASTYRPDVLNNPNYEADEQIEPDGEDW